VYRRLVASLLITALMLPVSSFASWRVNVNPWRERRQDDIAAVQVAVQSVAPFEDYIESLQPHFQMTADEAVNASIAQTRTQGTGEMSVLSAALNLRGPESTTTFDRQTDIDGDTTKTTSKSVESRKPGALSDATAPASLLKAVTADLPSTETAIDPSIKYNTAATLLQRLALQSGYVRDAAVRSRTKPYLVRLLVTVLPSAATRGYDAYTTVSFFSTGTYPNGTPIPPEIQLSASRWALESGWRARSDRDNAAKPDIALSQRTDYLQAASDEDLNAAVIEIAKKTKCGERPLETIPLLVTDTISSSLHSDSLEHLRDLALALQGITANTRFGGGLRTQNDRLDKTLTRNFNGVMTVSRVAQNSIEVRLGAMFGNRDDALVPRTYDVTALVLFPMADVVVKDGHKDFVSNGVVPCSVATYTAQTTFRNSQNGKVARPPSRTILNKSVEDFLENENLSRALAGQLVSAAQSGNYDQFRDLLAGTDSSLPPLLWARIVSVVGRHSFSIGSFQASVRDVQFFNDRTKGTVYDDGKGSTLTLVGAKNLLAERVVGTLTFDGFAEAPDPDTGKPDLRKPRTIHLPITSVDIGRDSRRVTLGLDSVSKYLKEVKAVSGRIDYVDGARDWETVHITARWPGTDAPTPALTYILLPKDPDPPAARTRFTLHTGTVSILSIDGRGTLTISLKHSRDEKDQKFAMFFSIDGADVVDWNAIPKIGGDWGSTDDGIWQISLANLVPGTPVTIRAWSLDNKKKVSEKDVVLSVQPRPLVIADED